MEKLNEALDLTRRMLAEAQQGNWERVQWLEARRRLILRNCFDTEMTLPAPELVHAMLRKIMKVDRQVAELVENARNEMAHLLETVQTGRVATRAYQKAGG